MLFGVLVGFLAYSAFATTLLYLNSDKGSTIYIVGGPFTWIILVCGDVYRKIHNSNLRSLVENKDGTIYNCPTYATDWIIYYTDGWDLVKNRSQFDTIKKYWNKANISDGKASMRYTPRKAWKNFPSIPNEIIQSARKAYEEFKSDDVYW